MACGQGQIKENMSFGLLTETIIQVHLVEDIQDTLDIDGVAYSIVPSYVSDWKEKSIYRKGTYEIMLRINQPNIALLIVDGKQYWTTVYPSDNSQISIKEYKLEDGKQLVRADYTGKGRAIYDYSLQKE